MHQHGKALLIQHGFKIFPIPQSVLTFSCAGGWIIRPESQGSPDAWLLKLASFPGARLGC